MGKFVAKTLMGLSVAAGDTILSDKSSVFESGIGLASILEHPFMTQACVCVPENAPPKRLKTHRGNIEGMGLKRGA